MASRWRCPPDSCMALWPVMVSMPRGRSATKRSRLAAARQADTLARSIALPKATLAASVSFSMTTCWLTTANCSRSEPSCHSRRSWPSNSTRPDVGSTNRGNRLASVVLPAPDAPTSATISPGLTLKLMAPSAGAPSSLKATVVSMNSICPAARCFVNTPPGSSGVASTRSSPFSMAARPRVMGLAISERCLMGATSISMAVTNATKLPTEVPSALL